MVDERDKEDSIHKVDTVPPPAGDGDAYNSPTKVGPVSQDAWAELIRKANEEGERNAAASGPASRPFPPKSQAPSSDKAPVSSSKPASSAAAPNAPLPRVYDENDDDDAATVLSEQARAQLGVPSAAPPAPPPTPPAASTAPAPPAPEPPPSVVPTPSAAPAALAAPASASVPPRVVRPLAFPPGDPAHPVPVAARSSFLDGRTLLVTGIICVAIFVVGLGVFLFAR